MPTSKLKSCINTVKYSILKNVGIGFRKIFPSTRWLIGILNTIFFLTGILMLIIALVAYVVPSLHIFFDAMKNICNVYTLYGTLIFVGMLSSAIGICGIYFTAKGQYDRLGLQGATFMVLLIILGAIGFSFYSEWTANALFGVSYATQSFQAGDNSSQYFNSIQLFLKCCGSNGPTDYNIGNENFRKNFVPISCCDTTMYFTYCRKRQKEEDDYLQTIAPAAAPRKTPQVSLEIQYAFSIGCTTKMEAIILPSIIMCMMIHGLLSLTCLILTALVCIGYHSFVKLRTDDNSLQPTADADYMTEDHRNRPLEDCRDNTAMELLASPNESPSILLQSRNSDIV